MLRKEPNNPQNSINRRFWRKMTVISFPIKIFRRLKAQITAFCAQNVVHAVWSLETSLQLAKLDHSSILTKNDNNFLPDWDISTFKCPNYCILCAEHSARRIILRNKPNNPQNSIIRRFWRKMAVISIPIEIFWRLKAQITEFCARTYYTPYYASK
jgi:hypothetical protein